MEAVAYLRLKVLSRDRHICVASMYPDAGLCHDKWGNLLPDRALRDDQLEMDYVRKGARGNHHELPCDHVALCAGHHRGMGPSGGGIWATSHRQELRDYLDSLYPLDER